jgi:hypothetical protein
MAIAAMSHQFQTGRLKAAGQMVTEAVAVKRHKQKMTMLLPACVSAWGGNRGQQNGMGKLCKQTIDRISG